MIKILNIFKKQKGFTLIELIVVLAVLGIIAAIAVPKYLGVKEQARVDADYSQATMIAKAAELKAAQENKTTFTYTKDSGLQIDFKQFNSSKISGVNDFECNGSGGVVTVTVENGGKTYTLYPRPAKTDSGAID